MAFGLSGRTDQTFMVGADATVAWVDNREGTPNAVDYFLTERVQVRKRGEGILHFYDQFSLPLPTVPCW